LGSYEVDFDGFLVMYKFPQDNEADLIPRKGRVYCIQGVLVVHSIAVSPRGSTGFPTAAEAKIPQTFSDEYIRGKQRLYDWGMPNPELRELTATASYAKPPHGKPND
jgi:hypothetical protein